MTNHGFAEGDFTENLEPEITQREFIFNNKDMQEEKVEFIGKNEDLTNPTMIIQNSRSINDLDYSANGSKEEEDRTGP